MNYTYKLAKSVNITSEKLKRKREMGPQPLRHSSLTETTFYIPKHQIKRVKKK
jgi:hypothetical protein